MKLYGKTTQNGTPTPDAPVPLETVGADGNVSVTVCGKNLIPYPYYRQEISGDSYVSPGGINFTVNADCSVTANGTNSGTGSDSGQFLMTDTTEMWLPVGEYTLSTGAEVDPGKNWYLMMSMRTGKGDSKYAYGGSVKFTVTEAGIGYVSLRILAGKTVNNLTIHPQLEVGSAATAYEKPAEKQTLPVSTPNGLPGIPVSSGGNYIDENGQMWVCDEINFARGKRVQRIKTVVLAGTGGGAETISGYRRYYYNVKSDYVKDYRFNVLCSHFARAETPGYGKCNITSDGYISLFLSESQQDFSAEQARAWLIENPTTVQYILATPTETDLTAEEIAQYSALHTNYPNTTIYNDEGAGMSVDYVADTKLYIDNKFTELAAALVNN
jgi:hypothetical protein